MAWALRLSGAVGDQCRAWRDIGRASRAANAANAAYARAVTSDQRAAAARPISGGAGGVRKRSAARRSSRAPPTPTAYPLSASPRPSRLPHLACPSCGQAARRVRRVNGDPARLGADSCGRFQCLAPGCGWGGLLALAAGPQRSLAANQARRWVPAAALSLVARAAFGLVLAAGVPAALVLLMAVGTRVDRQAAWSVPAGESHDGRAMPGPRAGFTAVAPGAPPVASAGQPGGAEPALALRQGCAWGKPGRMPYLGSTEQALRMARLPEEVVQGIAQMRRSGAVSDRLEISTRAIRTVSDGREFNPHSFAMSFGHTLCLDSRVNFAPGHVERANLYETQDRQGRHYAVMVPDVCGNVSVLGARGQRVGAAAVAAGLGEAPGPMAWLRSVVDGAGDGPGLLLLGGNGGAHTVPEPDSLACVLAALAALAWLRRRR